MFQQTSVLECPIGPRVWIDGREVDYFCGTSYYSLHGHPDVIEAACAAARESGLGAATSLATHAHVELDTRLRQFLDVETVTLVPSGYLAPLVLLQSLQADCDVVFVDRAAHYGELDAVRASGKRSISFEHLDANDLAQRLASQLGPRDRPLVLTDGVFPSTGAIAPLADYVAALSRYPGSMLCVDDAHGVGVLGPTGQGTLEHLGIDRRHAYACGTLSKAFGAAGGFVPGPCDLLEKIRAHSRVPVGASAPSAPAAAAASAAVRLLTAHPEMRQSLWSNAARLRAGIRSLGFDVGTSLVPIVNLVGHAGLDLRRAHARLADDGIAVLYVPPRGYSDAPDVESLRIAVFSTHSHEQLDRVVDALRHAL